MTHRWVEHMFYLVALVTVVVEGASSFINSSLHQFHVATILRGADNPTDVFVDHATNSILFVSFDLHYVGKLELPARCSAAASSNSTVTVIAGSRGQPDFQDGEGSAALFQSPFSITGDGTTYYVGDSGNHRIRAITSQPGGNYTVSTLAGSGIFGTDDGPGATAKFFQPCGIALSPVHDMLYVCDLSNNAIRRITLASRYVETLISDTLNTPILSPIFVVASPDGQYVYFSDSDHYRVGRVSSILGSNTSIITVAGTYNTAGLMDDANGAGASLMKRPRGLTITPDSSLLVTTDMEFHAVRVVRLRDNAMITIVGNGTAVEVDAHKTTAYTSDPVPACSAPHGITLWRHDDASFSLIWADYYDSIRCLEVAFDQPNIFPSSPFVSRRDVVSLNHVTARLFVDTSELGGVADVYVHPVTGAVFATMYSNASIVRCNTTSLAEGMMMPLNASSGGGCDFLVMGEDTQSNSRGGSMLTSPYGITGDVAGHVLYIGEFGGRRVRMVHLATNNVVSTVAGNGGTGFADGPGPNATFCGPAGVVLHHPSNVLYVADFTCSRIRKVNLSSHDNYVTTTTLSDQGSFQVNFMVPTSDFLHLFLTSPNSNVVFRMSFEDESTTVVAGGTTSGNRDGFGTTAEFSAPQSIALHGTSIDGGGWPCLYILESGTRTLREVRLRDQYTRTITLGGMPNAYTIQGMVPYYNATSLEFGLVVGTLEQHVYFISLGQRSTKTLSLSQTVNGTHVSTFSLTLSHSATRSATVTASSSLTPNTSRTFGSQSLSLSPSRATHSVISHNSITRWTFSLTPSRSKSSLSTTFNSTSSNTLEPTPSLHNFTKPTGSPSRNTFTYTNSSSLTVNTPATNVTDSLSSTASETDCGCGSSTVGFFMETGSCALCNMTTTLSTPNIVLLRSYASGSGSATPLGATLSATAVTRDALASGDVMFSATIRLANGRGASCWTIPSVTLDGVALGFSTTHVLDANGVALIELLLQPPHRGDGGTWLPSGLNMYTDAQLNLNLALSCHDRAGEPFVSSLVLRVPCPGRTRDLVGAVATAVETLQWVSVISGPGASSSVARVAAMRSMEMCGSDGLKGIVQIPTSACGDDDDNKSAEASRDGMTGNMVVIAASLTAGVLLCWLISVCSSAAYTSNSPWYVAMRTIAFPSCFTPVLVVTLPTTIAISIVLITGPAPVFCNVDMLLGIIGMLVALAVTGAPVLLWRCSIGRLEVHPETPNVQKLSPSPGGGVSSSQVQTWWIVRQWTRWTSIQRHWHLVVDRKSSFSSSSSESSKSTDRHTLTTAPPSPATFTWERHAALVLHEYHLLWYFVIDTAVLFVAGVLVGVTQSTPGTLVCGSCSIFVAVMYSAQFGLCFKVFPFTSFFGNVHGLLVLVLSAVSAILQATHIVLSSHTAYAVDHASALDQLMLASAVCDLMVMGTSGMRAVMDLIELALTIRRLASSFDPRGRHPPSGLLVVTSQRIDDDDNTTATSHSSDSDSVNASFNINIENSEDEKSEMSQAKFWDSEGMAMALLDEIAEEVIRPAAEEEQPDQYDEMLQAPVFDEPSPKVVDL